MIPPESLEFAIKRARFKARQVARKLPQLGGVDDLQQELLEDVVRRLACFNGAKAALKTYICRVIDHRTATLLENQRTLRRGQGRRPTSLDPSDLDESGEEAPALASDAPCRAQDLRLDVATVMQTLTPPLRDLCQRLQTQTPSEIVQETGLARSLIYERLATLRAIFANAQLHRYLKNSRALDRTPCAPIRYVDNRAGAKEVCA